MSAPPFHTVGLIGAGPIGIEMAVALKSAGIDYLHFDARQIGHTISWFAPQTRFFSSNQRISIAGVPLQTPDQSKATREQYLAYLRQIVLQFDLPVRTYEPVTAIDRRGEEFLVRTTPESGAAEYRFAKLILCTGGTERPRRLGIGGEDLPHVSHYFQDPHVYFRRRLLIVGGRNSAVEAALRCHHAGAEVTVSYRRERFDPTSIKYWLLPEINGLISSGQMRARFNTTPTRITARQVELSSNIGAASITEPFDFVLLLVGYEADPSLFRLAGVELTGAGQVPAVDPRTMESNVPGIFVAGCACGGTQERYALFLENCHVHVPRILAALQGQAPPANPSPQFAAPES